MKPIILAVCFTLGLVTSCLAGDYSYISADEMKSRIVEGPTPLIVDIQVEKEYLQHHLPGSVPTYAFPVKNATERDMLHKIVRLFQESDKDIVIVCPRGKGGAKRTYDYLLDEKIPAEKITILTKGIAGWPYNEILDRG